MINADVLLMYYHLLVIITCAAAPGNQNISGMILYFLLCVIILIVSFIPFAKFQVCWIDVLKSCIRMKKNMYPTMYDNVGIIFAYAAILINVVGIVFSVSLILMVYGLVS